MKNLSLILIAVLFVAVGILFYLHFATGKTSEEGPVTAERPYAAPAGMNIVYVNIDTLLDAMGF